MQCWEGVFDVIVTSTLKPDFDMCHFQCSRPQDSGISQAACLEVFRSFCACCLSGQLQPPLGVISANNSDLMPEHSKEYTIPIIPQKNTTRNSDSTDFFINLTGKFETYK
eukprot:2283575-Amphidinium_carterae.8